MNGVYIRELPTAEFVEVSLPWVHPVPGQWAAGSVARPRHRSRRHWRARCGPRSDSILGVFARMAPVVQERVSTLGEVPALVDFLFFEDPPIDPDSWQKAIGDDEVARSILQRRVGGLRHLRVDPRRAPPGHRRHRGANGRPLGKAQAPIRVAVTGKRVGPPLFESLEVLGRGETRRRLSAALDRLAAGEW